MENSGTITIRIIRSFGYRNIKLIVLKDVDMNRGTEEFLLSLINDIKDMRDIPPPVQMYSYDTLKIQHSPFVVKTNNPVINTEDDERLILNPGRTLLENGVCHETEMSLFKLSDYMEYKKSPEFKW